MQNLHQSVLSEGFLLEDITTMSATYRFGFTELNFTLCFGEDLDKNGMKKSDYFIVYSLRDEDCFDRASNVFEIDYIFMKKNDKEKYSNLVFCNKETKEIPEHIKLLLEKK